MNNMPQEVTAKLKFLKMGPRKVRLIADLVRGRRVTSAVNALTLQKQWAARPVLKLIRSAVASAKHNFKIAEENLKIKKITVDGGPVLKRWTPRAHGRATPIRERTCHILLVLEEMPVKEKKEKKTKK